MAVGGIYGAAKGAIGVPLEELTIDQVILFKKVSLKS